MAGLHRDSSGLFYVHYYFDRRRFKRSLRTTNEDEARTLKRRVEETIGYIKQGLIEVPEDPSPNQLWQILQSGGRRRRLPSISKALSLGKVCSDYINSYAYGAKEKSSLKTEQHHINHFTRILGTSIPFEDVTTEELQQYVQTRQKEPGIRGHTVQPVTISKELQTYRQIWKFAKSRDYVNDDNPVNDIKKPRTSQKMPFMVWEEIERRISRGGLTQNEIDQLWDCLFLRESEVGQFLEQVESVATSIPRIRYLYPALAFCAYTGARRSEMFRAQIDDVQDRVLLREKKRNQSRRVTFRHVPLHRELNSVLAEWLSVHPGGMYLFCKNNRKPLEDKTARDALDHAKQRSRWSVIRGYHILRHSFASNLARHGVDQYKIDEMVGHQTDEMRQRYRHLFPEDATAAVATLDFGRHQPEERHVLPLRL